MIAKALLLLRHAVAFVAQHERRADTRNAKRRWLCIDRYRLWCYLYTTNDNSCIKKGLLTMYKATNHPQSIDPSSCTFGFQLTNAIFQSMKMPYFHEFICAMSAEILLTCCANDEHLVDTQRTAASNEHSDVVLLRNTIDNQIALLFHITIDSNSNSSIGTIVTRDRNGRRSTGTGHQMMIRLASLLNRAMFSTATTNATAAATAATSTAAANSKKVARVGGGIFVIDSLLFAAFFYGVNCG